MFNWRKSFSLAELTNSEPLFADSEVLNYENESMPVDKSYRDSKTAFLPLPSNPPADDGEVIISCIEDRASQFQGHVPVSYFENLQVVR